MIVVGEGACPRKVCSGAILPSIIPAKAGIHLQFYPREMAVVFGRGVEAMRRKFTFISVCDFGRWVPAFAGMIVVGEGLVPKRCVRALSFRLSSLRRQGTISSLTRAKWRLFAAGC